VVKKKLDPILCKACSHNMGRSRCKVIDGKYAVRCNKCKTVHDIIIRFPETHSPNEGADDHGEAEQSGQSVGP